MRRIPLLFLLTALFLSSMKIFASSVEVSLMGSIFPGIPLDFGDPASNGFYLAYQNCIGGKVCASFVFPKEKESKIEIGCFLSTEADLFRNAVTFSNSRLKDLLANGAGMQLIATPGFLINFLTDSENSFFVYPGIRLSLAYADFAQPHNGSFIIKPFRSMDIGLSVDGGYRIWIPNGRFAVEAGLNFYWCPVVKTQFGNTIGNIYGTIGAGIFAGFCGRFGEPMFIPSP